METEGEEEEHDGEDAESEGGYVAVDYNAGVAGTVGIGEGGRDVATFWGAGARHSSWSMDEAFKGSI